MVICYQLLQKHIIIIVKLYFCSVSKLCKHEKYSNFPKHSQYYLKIFLNPDKIIVCHNFISIKMCVENILHITNL